MKTIKFIYRTIVVACISTAPALAALGITGNGRVFFVIFFFFALLLLLILGEFDERENKARYQSIKHRRGINVKKVA